MSALAWSDDEQDLWRREALQRDYLLLHEREMLWKEQVRAEREQKRTGAAS